MLIVGEKEEAENAVSVRKQGDGDTGTIPLSEFVSFLHNEVEKELN